MLKCTWSVLMYLYTLCLWSTGVDTKWRTTVLIYGQVICVCSIKVVYCLRFRHCINNIDNDLMNSRLVFSSSLCNRHEHNTTTKYTTQKTNIQCNSKNIHDTTKTINDNITIRINNLFIQRFKIICSKLVLCMVTILP